MPGIWEEVCRVWQGEPFQRSVEKQDRQCGSKCRTGTKPKQEEVKIDTLNINVIRFNGKCSVITANFKTSSNPLIK